MCITKANISPHHAIEERSPNGIATYFRIGTLSTRLYYFLNIEELIRAIINFHAAGFIFMAHLQ